MRITRVSQVLALLAIAVLGCSADTIHIGKGHEFPGHFPGHQFPGTTRAERVLLISVDGLHQQDLAQWVASNPSSTLGQLSRTGITYNNAFIDGVTDSFPGVLALTTGGNIQAHGVYYDDSYSHNLWAPGTACSNGRPKGPSGAEIVFDESIDIDQHALNGGGNANGAGSIDPKKLPLDSNCNPVYPHQFVLTNTIFEVARSKGLHTAWSDKHPAYDLLNGPSGQGIEELYTPEINSQVPGAPADTDYTTAPSYTMMYDTLHVDAAVNWIQGKDVSGKSTFVPHLFGFNLQTVSVTEKTTVAPGYAAPYDANGNFLQPMKDAMSFVDTQLARLVNELKAQNLYDKTTIIVTAKHGQAPIIPSKRQILPADSIENALKAAGITPAHVTADDVAIVWLSDKSQTAAAVAALESNKTGLGIDTVIYGLELYKQGLYAENGHGADIVVKVREGVIYAKKQKGAEHGGLNPDDQHVALLVSGGAVRRHRGLRVETHVYTRQVAPSILRLLGISPFELQAVQKEFTPALPLL